MAFTDLSLPMQNIVMVNLSFLLKILFLIYMFYFCYNITTYYKPKKESPFMGVKIMRFCVYILCKSVLFMSPFFLLTLFPLVSIDLFIKILAIIYGLIFSIGGTLVMVGVLQYGSLYFLDLIGMETDIKQKEIVINNFMGGMK